MKLVVCKRFDLWWVKPPHECFIGYCFTKWEDAIAWAFSGKATRQHWNSYARHVRATKLWHWV